MNAFIAALLLPWTALLPLLLPCSVQNSIIQMRMLLSPSPSPSL
jgi:hypothetical protein